jgi:DNA-binding IclR family transcriptional regulator
LETLSSGDKRKKKPVDPIARPRKSVLEMLQELGSNGIAILRYFEQVGGTATNTEIAFALKLDIAEVDRCVALLKEWGAIREAPGL